MLDAAAATLAATSIVTAMMPAAPPGSPAHTAAVGAYTTLISGIFDAIKSNAVVSPAGLPTPMNNAGGAVAGTGKIL